MSGPLRGLVHDRAAARIWGVVPALADAGLLVLADTAYEGTDAHILTPYKGRDKPEPQMQANRAHASLRSPGDEPTPIKSWRTLRNLRCCPYCAGRITKAIHALQPLTKMAAASTS